MKIRDIVRPLLQEIYQDDPWKMLVCCILLNLTKRQQVDGIRHELFTKYPTFNVCAQQTRIHSQIAYESIKHLNIPVLYVLIYI